MKDDLIDKISLLLLRNKFIVRVLKSNFYFDVVARDNDKIILVKVLSDANSIRNENADEMKKFASYINATPIIISEKAGTLLNDNVIYSRFGICTFNVETFENCIENRVFIKSTKAGLTASISGNKLKERLDYNNISRNSLSRKLGISTRMIIKYENENSEISFQRALKIYDLLGDVFNNINIFSFNNDLVNEISTDIAKKYSSLGFNTAETKKSLFDIIAKKEKEVILTKVGDKFDKNLNSFSQILNVNDLVIFENKRPKNVANIRKDEFLELNRADDLIKVIREFE